MSAGEHLLVLAGRAAERVRCFLQREHTTRDARIRKKVRRAETVLQLPQHLPLEADLERTNASPDRDSGRLRKQLPPRRSEFGLIVFSSMPPNVEAMRRRKRKQLRRRCGIYR
jgi:hypothetical protein